MSNHELEPLASRKGEEKDLLCGRAKREMVSDFEATQPIRFWRGEWWEWAAGVWSPSHKADVEGRVVTWAYDHYVQAPQKFWTAVQGFFRAAVTIPPKTEMPSWIGGYGERRCTVAVGAHCYLSCQDGLLNLTEAVKGNLTVEPHTPEFFNAVQLPIRVMEKKREPTRFLAFLEEIFQGDDEIIALVQEMMGYCLLAGNWRQTVFFLEGEGANGKTTLLRILQEVLGRTNCSKIPLAELGSRFSAIRTMNKLVNFCPDEDEASKTIEGKLKAYVGGDEVYADIKHLPGVEFTPTAKLFVDHNRRLRFADKSDGFWRRVRVIPFSYQIPTSKRDSRYILVNEDWYFWEELNGIFWWMVEGLKRLRSQPEFTLPSVCLGAAEEYRKENNPPGMFLDDSVMVRAGSTVGQAALYRLFKGWAEDSGFGRMSIIKFNREVRAWYKGETESEIEVLRPRIEGKPQARQWAGLSLLNDPVAESADLLRRMKNND